MQILQGERHFGMSKFGKGNDFTAREREIHDLLMEGFGREQIAARLGIAPYTVKDHTTSILRKAKAATQVDMLATRVKSLEIAALKMFRRFILKT
jgi:DNA-binding CsgD family transcriptional regulator